MLMSDRPCIFFLLPIKGPEIQNSLLGIEANFEQSLKILREIKKTMLVPQDSSWHDAFARYKLRIKDLEVNGFNFC